MEINKKALFVAILYVITDLAFHYFFTTPQESTGYFTLKFIIAYFVTSWVIKSGKSFIGGLIVSSAISLYYRLFELFNYGFEGFGKRAPDILGINRNNTILFASVWFFFHALAYYFTYKGVENYAS